MVNVLNPAKSEAWATVLQEVLYEKFVGKEIADTKFEGLFTGNTIVHFPRMAQITTLPLATSYSPVTLQDLVTTDEEFVLDQRTHFAVEISNEDNVELSVDPSSRAIQDAAMAFARDYDRLIMSQYVNAGYVVDDGDMQITTNGGTGNPIILTKNNIYDMVTAVEQQMDEANMPQEGRFLVISPREKRFFVNSPEFLRSTQMGDGVVAQGMIGTVSGLSIIVSNNINVTAGVRNLMAGCGKPICFAANIRPNVEITPSIYNSQKFVTTLKGQTKFGAKVFFEGGKRLIHVPVQA